MNVAVYNSPHHRLATRKLSDVGVGCECFRSVVSSIMHTIQ
jgi:hypothetical protein